MGCDAATDQTSMSCSPSSPNATLPHEPPSVRSCATAPRPVKGATRGGEALHTVTSRRVRDQELGGHPAVLKVDTFQLGMYAGIAKNHQQDSATAISLTRRSPFSSAGPRTATRTFPIGAGFVAKRGDDAEVPVLLHDAILRNAHVGALILGLVLGGLSGPTSGSGTRQAGLRSSCSAC
jgi:hypothetical protein